MINVYAKFEVPIVTHYGNTKGNAKCIKYKKSHMKRLAIKKRPSRTLQVIAIANTNASNALFLHAQIFSQSTNALHLLLMYSH